MLRFIMPFSSVQDILPEMREKKQCRGRGKDFATTLRFGNLPNIRHTKGIPILLRRLDRPLVPGLNKCADLLGFQHFH